MTIVEPVEHSYAVLSRTFFFCSLSLSRGFFRLYLDGQLSYRLTLVMSSMASQYGGDERRRLEGGGGGKSVQGGDSSISLNDFTDKIDYCRLR